MEMQTNRRQAISSIAGLAAAAIYSPPSLAQVWPNGPIKMIHGFAAGSTPDILARQIAPVLSEKIGSNVSILIDPRPGGGERLAASQIGKIPGDGQSIYLMTGGLTVITATDKAITFDLLKDFSFISLLNQYPFMFLVAPNSPLKTLGDLIEAAKKNPGKISYSTSGIANTLHMTVELLSFMQGISMHHIPYKGTNAFTDLIGGILDMSVSTPSGAQALIRSGRMRPLCVTSSKRWPGLEDVPAASETVPGFDVVTWSALVAPSTLPLSLRDRLNKATVEALQVPELAGKIEAGGSQARHSSPDELRNRVITDIAKWKKVAEFAKIEI